MLGSVKRRILWRGGMGQKFELTAHWEGLREAGLTVSSPSLGIKRLVVTKGEGLAWVGG